MKLTRPRVISALAAVVALATGCAAIPVGSPVMLGGTAIVADAAVGFIAAGPEHGQGPEAIVRGFLLAAQSGPTMPTTFAAARQYLTLDAAYQWRPGTEVWVLDGTAALELLPSTDPNQAVVRATGGAIARVSSEGIYTEFRFPEPHVSEFLLRYDGEDWRIATLDDGIVMPAQVFTAAYRYTKLYHPSFDFRTWVSEVRWFPQQTWRTHAIQELLAGPPSFLVDVVQPAVPDNAAVTLDEITETAQGYEVRLHGWLRDADAFHRALFQAQLSMLLTDGSGTQYVGLADPMGPIPVPGYELPQLPGTVGSAVAVAEGGLYWVSGRDLVPVTPEVDLSGLDISAIAVAPGGADGVVIRHGDSELWWLDPALEAMDLVADSEVIVPNELTDPPSGYPLEPSSVDDLANDATDELGNELGDELVEDTTVEIPPGRTRLLAGTGVLALFIDDDGLIWTGTATGPVQVVDYTGAAYEVTANWLNGYLIERLMVAPGGRRVAVVIRDHDGTRLLVAGVIRDSQGTPIGLAEPIEVGASVREVSAVAWQDNSVLAVIGWLGAVPGVYLVGVGGLDAPGGLPRLIPGITEPQWLTASVGTGNMLAIDQESFLHLREATSLWPIVGREVTFVAYPG